MNQLDRDAEIIIETLSLRAKNGHVKLSCLSKNCGECALDDGLLCKRHCKHGAISTTLLERLVEHKAYYKALKVTTTNLIIYYFWF